MGLRARRVGLLAASVLVALVIAEVGSRLLLPDAYYVWPPDFRTVFHPDPGVIEGVRFPARLSINAFGMRGDPPGSDDRYRLLAVGGSTTICVYLDDRRTWPHRLQEHLNAALGPSATWVGNVGRPGHTSAQHGLQIEKLLAQEPALDAVVALVGVNDMLIHLALLAHPPPSGAPSSRPHRDLASAFSLFPDWDADAPWYQRNFLGRLVRRLRWRPMAGAEGVPAMDARGDFVELLRGYRRRAGSLRRARPDLDSGLLAYAERLERIVDRAEAGGARLVLVTQPTIWREGLSPDELERLWAGGPPLDRLADGAAYHAPEVLAWAMQRYNETLLATCRARGVECVDAAARLPKTPAVFYDDMHFTDHGADAMARLLAGHFLRDAAPLLESRRSD